jgi:biopolymer transport protein ExbD
MAFSSRGRGPQADINVTPLVDVVLVLLIIFMVITPMLQEGPNVRLPKAANNEASEESTEATLVSVKRDGSIYVGDIEMDVEQLRAELAMVLEPDPHKYILIKGDMFARYADVRVVMEICEELGAKSVGLQTDDKPKTKKRKG